MRSNESQELFTRQNVGIVMALTKTYTKRLVRIAEIVEEHSIYHNEWAPPPKPEKYLAVEYLDGDAVWAYGDEDLEELKAAIMLSDTDRDAVKVFDLDTQAVYLPVWTLSHFVEEQQRHANH